MVAKMCQTRQVKPRQCGNTGCEVMFRPGFFRSGWTPVHAGSIPGSTSQTSLSVRHGKPPRHFVEARRCCKQPESDIRIRLASIPGRQTLRRQTKVISENDLLVNPCRSPWTQSLPAPVRCGCAKVNRFDLSVSSDLTDEFIVVHDRKQGKAAKLLEQLPAHEDTLVAVGHLQKT